MTTFDMYRNDVPIDMNGETEGTTWLGDASYDEHPDGVNGGLGETSTS